MSVKRRRLAFAIAASFFLIGGVSLVCCSRTNSSQVEVAPDSRAESRTESRVEPPQPSETKVDVRETEPPTVQSAPPSPEIDVSTPERLEPDPPHYVAVMDRYEPDAPSRVHVKVVRPAKLELQTENVKRLRITREGLPLPRDRSVILRIDDQGIEWTSGYIAIELERSSVGVWEVTQRKPAKP